MPPHENTSSPIHPQFPAPSPDIPPLHRVTMKASSAFARMLHIEAMSGIVLLIAAAIALIWANSPWAAGYFATWHAPLALTLGPWTWSTDLHFFVNDVLMTIFFLVVGMEIRREMYNGALADVRQALLPIIAALGGVVVPALIYVALARGDAQLLNGWAIPTATDIAFAVGVLALLGKSIPGPLRIFLLALAIIDDIVAVLIIAFFYSGGLDYSGFGIALVGLVLVLLFNRMGVAAAWAYVVPGAILWLGLLHTGAHPTLAGVVLGLMTPVTMRPAQRHHLDVAEQALTRIRSHAQRGQFEVDVLHHELRIASCVPPASHAAPLGGVWGDAHLRPGQRWRAVWWHGSGSHRPAHCVLECAAGTGAGQTAGRVSCHLPRRQIWRQPPARRYQLARRAAGRCAGGYRLYHGHFCRWSGVQRCSFAQRCQAGHSGRLRHGGDCGPGVWLYRSPQAERLSPTGL